MRRYVWSVKRQPPAGGIVREIETYTSNMEDALSELKKIYPITHEELVLTHKCVTDIDILPDVDKPVIMMWGGQSLKILDDNIKEFLGKDVYFMDMSMQYLYERRILTKINRYSNFRHACDPCDIDEFVYRALSKDDVFIMWCNEDQQRFWDKVPVIARNRSYFSYDYCTDPRYVGGGMQTILSSVMRLGMKRIFMFGMDGGYAPGKRYYFDAMYDIREFIRGRESGSGVMNSDMNKLHFFWQDMNILLGKDNVKTEIYNVNLDSKVSVFKKISFDEMKGILSWK